MRSSPPGGKVAGKGYAYFLKREWQLFFNSSSAGPPHCDAVTVNGRRVAVLETLGGGKYTCSEPAGRPIYVVELAAECSTLPGDHSHGTSASALERCARRLLRGAVVKAWVDGQRVARFGKLSAATREFRVRIPKNRFHGVTQRHARSAAFGYALLLMDLDKGTHKIHSTATGFGMGGKDTFESLVTLHVH